MSNVLAISANKARFKTPLEWNQTYVPYPNVCIHELFAEQVVRTPHLIAVSCGTHQLTYSELNVKANEVANRLRSLNVGPESLVGICLERSIEMLVGLLGILKAGGAYLPLDPEYPVQRLQFMLEDSNARFLLTNRTLLSDLPPFSGTTVLLDAEDLHSSQPDTNPAVTVRPRNLAYTLYTSGSTGRPKGVQIEHRSVVNFLTSMGQVPGLTSDDVMMGITTLSFDISGLELFLPLITGARVEIVTREIASDGESLRAAIENSGATVMQATPVSWRMLLHAGWPKRQLKVICGGEALSRELARKLLGNSQSVWNVYGPTETTIWSSLYRITGDDDSAIVPIGRPIANTQMYVLNERLESVEVGESGELFIGGEGLARGYANRPELTAEKFIANPFQPGARLYRTGDLARYREAGDIEFIGRKDHQVKIRGYRIELGELEAILEEHPDVRHAAVTVQEVEGDARITAYFVPKESGESLAQELRIWAKTKLPQYMVPTTFVQVDRMPLTANGKVDRGALPESAGDHYFSSFQKDDIEQNLVSIWKALLGRDDVGVDDDFFESGGHSLLAVKVMQRVEQRFGVKLPIVTVFHSPTVRLLANKLRDTLRNQGSLPSAKPAGATPTVASSAEKVHPKLMLRRVLNRILHLGCRFLPGATVVRPALHRLRGVRIGRDVFIGDDVYLENEYPERVDIQNGVTLGLRSIVVAHGMGGPGRVVIEDNAFIGCNSLLITSRGRTLTIGEGSVVMAGSVVTANVPPFASVGPSSRESVSLA